MVCLHKPFRSSELLWCDFNSPSIQFVSHLNITPPGTTSRGPYRPPTWPPGGPPNGPGGPDRRPDRPRGPHRPWPDRGLSPLVASAPSEWLRAATHRSTLPQPHVSLDYSGMVSFYHPRLRSLASARAGMPMRKHRVWANISEADAMSIVHEVDDVLGRKERGSGMNWGIVAQQVVEYWADRLLQLRTLVTEATSHNSFSSPVNLTEVIINIRLLAYTPLNPYMDAGSSPNASGWDIFFGSSAHHILDTRRPLSSPSLEETAFDRCIYSMAGFLSHPTTLVSLTQQEMILKASVESVLRRLCSDVGTIFADSVDLDLKSIPAKGLSTLR